MWWWAALCILPLLLLLHQADYAQTYLTKAAPNPASLCPIQPLSSAMASSTITINASGDYTHYRKPELCSASIRISHESDDQGKTVETVKTAANELQEYLKRIAPKSAASTPDGTASTAQSDKIETWSMSSISKHSWMPYVPPEDKKKKSAEPKRQHRATVRFTIVYKDWELLSKMILELSQREDVYIDGLSWRLTEKTQAELAKTVRQASIKAAMTKAIDYLSALYASEDEESLRGKLKCVEINAGATAQDFSSQPAPPRMTMMRSMKASGAYGEGDDALNFEPEDVSLSDSVSCRFAFER